MQCGKDLDSCEMLSLIGQMLAMAADRSMLKPPKRQDENKLLLRNARYFDKKIKKYKRLFKEKKRKDSG